MRKSLKAGLLSALEFPGNGHFLRRNHLRGMLLAEVSLAGIYVVVSTAFAVAQKISNEMLSDRFRLILPTLKTG